MQLLYITNGINGSGGLERVLSVKASELATRFGHKVTIVTLNEFPIAPFYDFSPEVQFESIGVSGNPVRYLRTYLKGLSEVISRVSPDVIIVCDDGLKAFFLPWLLGSKIPVIYERHVSKLIESRQLQTPVQVIATRAKWKLMDLLAGKFTRFVLLTEGTKKEWKHLKNTVVIPNPLPFYPDTASDLTAKKVIAVGKMSYQKGYDLLLQSWQLIHAEFSDWKLEIYGKKDLISELEQQAVALGIRHAVCFSDPVTDIETKYLQSSVYAMSSRYEGFGMVLIEAMACGVPCVSFDCDFGPSEIIADGVDGLLVENGNCEQLAKALGKLMRNESLRRTYGMNARENVRRYSTESVVETWDELLTQVRAYD